MPRISQHRDILVESFSLDVTVIRSHARILSLTGGYLLNMLVFCSTHIFNVEHFVVHFSLKW